ncbi:MAG: hypothetical protein LPH21_15800, partial [Shewanella sp.]|nr:hypothetical protein [Shewanella sp.]
ATTQIIEGDFYTPKGYSQLRKTTAHFRSFTIAALIHAGYLNLKGTLITATKGNGKFNVFCYLTSKAGTLSSSAGSYWKSLGCFDKDMTSLSKVGLNKAADSMDGGANKELKADPEIIAAMLKAFKTGGKHTIKGEAITFSAVKMK